MTDVATNGNSSTMYPDADQQIESESEALQVLLDADIDKVMAGLDHIVEAAPSYKKLFSRWENQQWSTEQFDFTIDKQQWDDPEVMPDSLERDTLQWSLSAFFLGEERVTTELLPFAIAAPDYEQRAFLATQISDEAKHSVFFDRFYREVFGVDGVTLSENIEAQRPEDEQGLRQAVRRHPARLRREPAQGPVRLRRAGARHHRLHAGDRGHDGVSRARASSSARSRTRTSSRDSGRASPPSTATSRATSASASSSSPTPSSRTRRTARSSPTRSRKRFPLRRRRLRRRSTTTPTTGSRRSASRRRRCSTTPSSRCARSSSAIGIEPEAVGAGA